MTDNDTEDRPNLGLMRLKDVNEALGLSVRLLAGEAPFRDMPLGSSIGALITAVDSNRYVFATRGDRAVGTAYWAFVEPEHAEAWINRTRPLQAGDFLEDGRCVIIMGVQAVDTTVVRYLIRKLRDTVLRHCDVCYYIRDYGNDGKGTRGVRLIRPRIRR